MRYHFGVVFAVSVLQYTLVQAVVFFKPDGHPLIPQARAAYEEALAVARKVVTDLGPPGALDNAQVSAAYTPLFDPSANPNDIGKVVDLFRFILQFSQDTYTSYKVTIFVTEDHIQSVPSVQDPGYDDFVDNAFVNLQGKALQYPVEDPFEDGRMPSEQGSYTLVGNDNAGAEFGCSDQAHTVLATRRFSPDPSYETRSLDSIKRDGFDPHNVNLRSLSNIQPLSYIILHELAHAAGRNTGGATGSTLVTDGEDDPHDPNTPYYGWQSISAIRGTRTRKADAYAILGMALYLDTVNNVRCYWSEGVVDPATGQPPQGTTGPASKRELHSPPSRFDKLGRLIDKYLPWHRRRSTGESAHVPRIAGRIMISESKS